jgi:hypothetical protein
MISRFNSVGAINNRKESDLVISTNQSNKPKDISNYSEELDVVLDDLPLTARIIERHTR